MRSSCTVAGFSFIVELDGPEDASQSFVAEIIKLITMIPCVRSVFTEGHRASARKISTPTSFMFTPFNEEKETSKFDEDEFDEIVIHRE